MCSENKYVKREYNAIRLNIALLLRTLFTIEEQTSPRGKIEALKRFSLALEERDIIANGTLDKLIREQKITSDMATSLMKDNSYAYEIQSKLISAVEIIFANFISTEKDLSLSDEETDRLMSSRREEILDQLRQEEAQIDAIAGRENRDGNLDRGV